MTTDHENLTKTITSALGKIPKRAESRNDEELRSTFEDSGVGQALDTVDHQIIYGRRGTGKTHALKYLTSTKSASKDISIYVDLRTLGSAEGIFMPQTSSAVYRTSRLLHDLILTIHDSLMRVVIDHDELISNKALTNHLDELSESVREVRSSEGAKSFNFSKTASALKGIDQELGGRRTWLLLDEWTSTPADLQPYLGAFIVRTILPLQSFTVKIAAIERQANFREAINGTVIGIEVGADMSANLNLDDFMVFELEEERSRKFFLRLFYKHLKATDELQDSLVKEVDVVRHGFTDSRAFDELVRASEGVPRDAINIAAKAAFRAGANKISIPDIRKSARSWYQTDKETALVGESQEILNWMIDKVIRGKKARGFLVDQRQVNDRALLTLFDARVLHIAKRGYSAQDSQGERFDVYIIDYGAYVDLIGTHSAPETGLGPLMDERSDDSYGNIEVPTQDLRALRRAVLDIKEFRAHQASDSIDALGD